MSYAVFVALLCVGLAGSIILAILRKRWNLSWFDVAFPFCLGWIVATANYVWLILTYPR